jgi:hypothetical protein
MSLVNFDNKHKYKTICNNPIRYFQIKFTGAITFFFGSLPYHQHFTMRGDINSISWSTASLPMVGLLSQYFTNKQYFHQIGIHFSLGYCPNLLHISDDFPFIYLFFKKKYKFHLKRRSNF